MGKMRRDKLIVTFDEDARKEYLTGFRKRKQERRKVAQDNIKEMERKAKKEARDEVGTLTDRAKTTSRVRFNTRFWSISISS